MDRQHKKDDTEREVDMLSPLEVEPLTPAPETSTPPNPVAERLSPRTPAPGWQSFVESRPEILEHHFCLAETFHFLHLLPLRPLAINICLYFAFKAIHAVF